MNSLRLYIIYNGVPLLITEFFSFFLGIGFHIYILLFAVKVCSSTLTDLNTLYELFKGSFKCLVFSFFFKYLGIIIKAYREYIQEKKTKEVLNKINLSDYI